jgi:mannose-6-phosphate isomerase-like protein (cupin superfamily)
MDQPSPRYRVVDFDQIRPVGCPCGTSRRALADAEAFPGTIHRTEIVGLAKPHFHRRLTETYYILHCEPGAALELDGQRVPLKPGLCVLIPPGTVHRALGTMTILNIVFPKFDPADEVVGEGVVSDPW